MMTDWRDEFDRAIIDRNKAVWDAIEWKARAEAAEKRVAELEAAQAEAWRSVANDPPPPEERIIVRSVMFRDITDHWYHGENSSAATWEWQPLPAPTE